MPDIGTTDFGYVQIFTGAATERRKIAEGEERAKWGTRTRYKRDLGDFGTWTITHWRIAALEAREVGAFGVFRLWLLWL